MYTDITDVCVTPGWSIHQVLTQMDVSRKGIALVVDDRKRLLGTITDGDMRRAVLAGENLEQPVTALLDRKTNSAIPSPVSVPNDADPSTMLEVLTKYRIRHLPLVDHDQQVVALATLDDFVVDREPPLQAVIMAGGMGLRLRPLTDDVPKPMLPVGDQPLLEIIVEQLRDAGIKQLNVAVHHQSEKITEHFGDGQDFGVQISYVTEESPLGTAGAIGLVAKSESTILMIFGDIYTQVDFRAMLAYHREQQADLTVGVRQYDMQVPYGVIECDGNAVRHLAEKPTINFLVNAGIYLLEPKVHQSIPSGEPSDMTEIIERLIQEKMNVVAFPIHEGWIDIGQLDNYEQAQINAKKRRVQ